MSQPWLTSGAVERLVAASPVEVYDVVSDVCSTGERSTECRRVEWLPGSPQAPVVGARFRGYNRFRVARWSRVCEIVDARPGEAFAFRTIPERVDPSRRDSTTWRYELTPAGDGTLVRHSYEITQLPLLPFRVLYGVLLPHHKDMRASMGHTLETLAGSLAVC